MPETTIQVKGYLCNNCGHKWTPRKTSKPPLCPKCHSPYWDWPKK